MKKQTINKMRTNGINNPIMLSLKHVSRGQTQSPGYSPVSAALTSFSVLACQRKQKAALANPISQQRRRTSAESQFLPKPITGEGRAQPSVRWLTHVHASAVRPNAISPPWTVPANSNPGVCSPTSEPLPFSQHIHIHTQLPQFSLLKYPLFSKIHFMNRLYLYN